MAYFGKYIQQLLQKKEDVILPGFGSLNVVKSTGVKDSAGILHPPGLIVKFDPEHPKDDGKLANLYADREGMELEEAHQQVLELIDAIKFRLDKGESFELEDLGVFSRDDENRIHFRKSDEWVLDPDSFGLEPLELLELENESETDTPSENTIEKGSREEEGSKSIVFNVDNDPMEKKQIKKPPVNKWKIIWIVVGGLIIVLVTLLLIPSGNDGVEFNKEGIIIRDTVSTNPTSSESEEKQTDTEVSNPLQANDDLAAAEEKAKERTEEKIIDINQKETEVKFYIISGSFQNLINASDMRDELVADGFPAEIIYTENRLYRVSIKSYTSKETANSDLGRVRRESGIDRAWILAR